MRSFINQNAKKTMNQEKYNKKYNIYTEKYENTKSKILKAEDKKQDLISRRYKIQLFIDSLKLQNRIISEFDENIWYSLVEKVMVNVNGLIDLKLKN